MMMQCNWRSTVVLLTVAVLSLGCDRGERRAAKESPAGEPREVEAGTSEQTPLAFPKNDWKCTPENAERIDAWLTAWDEWRAETFDFDSHKIELVQLGDDAAGDAKVDRSALATLALRSDAVLVNGVVAVQEPESGANVDPLAKLAQSAVGPEARSKQLRRALVDEIDKKRRQLEALGVDDKSGSVRVAVGRDVSVKRVLAAVRHVAQIGIDRVGFVFETPEPPADIEQMPEEVAQRLKVLIGPSGPATKQKGYDPDNDLAKASRKAVEGCPQVVEVHRKLEQQVSEKRLAFLADHLGEAWLACECRADIELVLTTKVWRDADTVIATSLDFATDEAIEVLRAHEDADWDEAVEHLLGTAH